MTVADLRQQCADYMRQNADDFAPFIAADEHSKATNLAEYTDEIEKTAIWGGELEIQALAKVWSVQVVLYSAEAQTVKINVENETLPVLQFAFHRHMYSLGSHYNSVVHK